MASMKYRDATEQHTVEMFEKLSADDGLGNVGVNTQSIKGDNPEQYPETPAPGAGAGTLDATWGQEPPAKPEKNFSDVTIKSFREGRENLLARLLDEKKPSDKTEQATVSALLDSAAKGEFETSSPQLSDKSKLSSAAAIRIQHETLLEQVRRIMP